MSFPMTQPNFTANGNIRPSRFFTGVSGNGNARLAVEATGSTTFIYGVTGENTRGPAGIDDTYIAIAGESLRYYGPLQMAPLLLGGTVSNAMVPLTSDGSGRGIAQAPADGTLTYYGGIALDTGVSGDIILVYVLPSFQY